MINKFTKFNNDDRAFSGLEAAIVLIAFVVVAAAFAFAVLNAGFFVTQEATGAIHTGIEEATSALQIGGDVVAGSTGINITFVEVPVMLAAGGRPIDLSVNRSIVSYVDIDHSVRNLHRGLHTVNATAVPNATVNITWILRHDPVGAEDHILEAGELAIINVPIHTANITAEVPPVIPGTLLLRTNEVFTITIQPPQGAALTVERRIPSFLDTRMILR